MQSVRRNLFFTIPTPDNNASAGMQTLPAISFDRAPNEDDALALINDLKGRDDSPELAIVQQAYHFVNTVSNNRPVNINEKIADLIHKLKLFQVSHANETGGAFAYCTLFLATQMRACSLINPHFGIFYVASPLKAYLDLVGPHPQSPTRNNNHSPQKHNTSPFGSPTKG